MPKKKPLREPIGKAQILFRPRQEYRDMVEQLSRDEDIDMSEVVRRLLEPTLQLVQRYGFHEVTAELRRQANEALGLKSTTLSRQVARAKAKLPLKSTGPKSGGPKMQFG